MNDDYFYFIYLYRSRNHDSFMMIFVSNATAILVIHIIMRTHAVVLHEYNIVYACVVDRRDEKPRKTVYFVITVVAAY